ncbi:MAG: bifunctional tetrahydrofolate synthase/dihydrofolate synthase, partial [Pseudomonadales bacterium]|nr:bifunctional tetrahydrofolate synthase/dihydrofolate synthase [Pseudomonadales bacterium]
TRRRFPTTSPNWSGHFGSRWTRMNLDDWLHRIENLHPRKWDLGLERVGEVGRRLDVLKPAPRVFLVAGTNGKGSACETIDFLCRRAGLRTGKSVSPHLVRFNERIVVDGEPAGDDEICGAFEAIEAARGDTSLSYFEFGALAAMYVFRSRRVEAAVLEIGLGGRLDAMNIVAPDVSIITRIALDHEAWLGSDREQIGAEKAGILRAGVPLVLSDRDPPASVLARAQELGAPLYRIDEAFGRDASGYFMTRGNDCVRFDVASEPALPLPSVVAGIQAVSLADIEPGQEDIRMLVQDLTLAGRFQRLQGVRETILDVAHNPDAAQHLAARMAPLAATRRVHAVFGMYADKDYKAVIGAMKPYVSRWYACQADEPRALARDELAACLSAIGGSVAGSYAKVSDAYDAALEHSEPGDLVLVFGSFPIVGGVLEHLGTRA